MIKEAVRIRVLQLLDTEKKLVIKETVSELGFAIAGYREEVDFICKLWKKNYFSRIVASWKSQGLCFVAGFGEEAGLLEEVWEKNVFSWISRIVDSCLQLLDMYAEEAGVIEESLGEELGHLDLESCGFWDE